MSLPEGIAQFVKCQKMQNLTLRLTPRGIHTSLDSWPLYEGGTKQSARQHQRGRRDVYRQYIAHP